MSRSNPSSEGFLFFKRAQVVQPIAALRRACAMRSLAVGHAPHCRRPLVRFADTCAVLQLDGLDAAALRRLRQRLRPRAHAQLSEQRLDMKLHSMERDVQPPCY